jgi:hypothetical protein
MYIVHMRLGRHDLMVDHAAFLSLDLCRARCGHRIGRNAPASMERAVIAIIEARQKILRTSGQNGVISVGQTAN